MRRRREGRSPVMVALVVIALVAVGSYLGFRKDIPFTKGFRMNAVFTTSNNLRPNSPVRIAGVDVGKVKKISRYKNTDMSVVEMEIQDKGLPIHKDATLKIRPRIFLEGNFFVDLSPGSPGSPAIGDGDTIRVTQTAAPVQLDEILTTLQSDTREDLKTLLAEYGNALDGDPAASDRLMTREDPSTKGETGAQALNDTYPNAGPALRGASILNQATLGTQKHDLSRLIGGLQKVTAALGRNEGLLQSWLENFNGTLSIFADEKANVSATIRELPSTLRVADRTLADLNSSFPSVRRFSREILPGVRETAPTITAAFPWIRQVRALVQPAELQGLARDLRPASRDLAAATDAAVTFFPLQNLFARCLNEVILPTGDIKITEPPSRKQFETGVENYKEFWYTMVGLAGESQNFDGNGQYVRFQPGGGTQTFSTGRSTSGGAVQFGNPAATPLGVRPRWPGTRPPYRPDVACYKNPLPDLNSAVTGPPNFGQGPASGGGGSTASSGSTTAGPTPALPQVPQLTVPAAGARASAASRSTATARSLSAELVSRLNPYRTAKRTTGRAAKR